MFFAFGQYMPHFARCSGDLQFQGDVYVLLLTTMRVRVTIIWAPKHQKPRFFSFLHTRGECWAGGGWGWGVGGLVGWEGGLGGCRSGGWKFTAPGFENFAFELMS